jgi:hypothetical protein
VGTKQPSFFSCGITQPLFIYLFFLWVLRNPHFIIFFLVGTTQPSPFLWVLCNPHISCGYYATLIFLVGTTQPSYFLWVLRNPRIFLVGTTQPSPLVLGVLYNPHSSFRFYITVILRSRTMYPYSFFGFFTQPLSFYLGLSTLFLHSGAMEIFSIPCLRLVIFVGLCTHTFPLDPQATLITLPSAYQRFSVCRRLIYSCYVPDIVSVPFARSNLS